MASPSGGFDAAPGLAWRYNSGSSVFYVRTWFDVPAWGRNGAVLCRMFPGTDKEPEVLMTRREFVEVGS